MLTLYHMLSTLAGPLMPLLLWLRQLAGKEDPARISERMGHAHAARAAGRLVWIHAASVGEALSALPLLRDLLLRYPDLHALITTGTVTSARILAQQLPQRASHHYAPLDRPQWVRRFLDAWRPDAAIWIESELWPNMLLETAGRGIPMALVNGRLSARSFRRWHRAPNSIARLLGCFRIILARDEQSAGFLRQLDVRNVVCAGDLKHATGPLAADNIELARLRAMIAGRPVWLAASTHPGEESAARQAHDLLRPQFPGLLTVIAPRHADRGMQIAAMLAASGLRTACRSKGEVPDRDTDIYLADTMGEMGLIYGLSRIAFTGGSLVPHGGQNPLEPARLGCAVLHGPNVDNFAAIYADLEAAGAARRIDDTVSLANAVAALLRDPKTAIARGLAGKAYAATGRDSVLEHIAAAIAPLFAEPAK